jgi:two-component system, sensor histidine kinase LadS
MEKKFYEICCDVNSIGPIVSDIVSSVSDHFDSAHMIEVALHEAIYNAIEHGNFEITSKKKRDLLNKGEYDEFIRKILSTNKAQNKQCSKKVKIWSTVSEDILKIEIEDDGKGFDWKKEIDMLKKETGKVPDAYNGYGLKIIKAAFDEMSYNEKGNKLTLVKYL